MAASYGLWAETAERHPGFRVGARFYVDLSQPDRPHSARRPRAQIGDAGAFRILGRGHRTAHARRAAPELFTSLFAATVNAVFGTIIAWVAGALPLPRRVACSTPLSTFLRAADRGRRHRPYRALCAERLDRAVARSARHQSGLHADSALPSRSSSSVSPSWCAPCSRCSRNSTASSRRLPPPSAPTGAKPCSA